MKLIMIWILLLYTRFKTVEEWTFAEDNVNQTIGIFFQGFVEYQSYSNNYGNNYDNFKHYGTLFGMMQTFTHMLVPNIFQANLTEQILSFVVEIDNPVVFVF